MTVVPCDRIAYTEMGLEHRGNGPGFLLVHGLGGARQQWLTVQRGLSPHAYSIAIDVPGFGASRMNGRFEMFQAAARVATFVRDHGIEDLVMVSHSIGCTIAAIVAATPGIRFQRTVLISGTLFGASKVARRPWRMLTTGQLGRAVAAQFLVGAIPLGVSARRLLATSAMFRRLALWPFVAAPVALDPQVVAEALEGSGSPTVWQVLKDAQRIDLESMIAAIPHPVDLVWGASDRLVSVDDVKIAYRLCGIVNTHEISDCGHWPMVEHTDVVVSLLLKWRSSGSNET